MEKIYFLCGIQGSCKSTFAKNHYQQYNANIISTDQIRKENKIEEKDVFPTAYKLIVYFINNGNNVIFDATNIDIKSRKINMDSIKNLLSQEVEFICICLITNKEICKQRVEKRNKLNNEIYLPLEVIDKYESLYQEPTLEEGFNEIIFVK